jgi:hypothetical protein
MLVTCPSGLIVDARKLRVAEANILADKQAAQRGTSLDQMLTNVTEHVVDPGPYQLVHGKLNWEQCLTGDRYYAQMMVRVETHGKNFEFKVPCSVCGRPIEWELSLLDLPVKPLKEADRQTFIAGNKFRDQGPDGLFYEFHLLTGESEKKAQQILKSNRTTRMTASLLARVDAVESKEDRRKHLNDLDFTLALDLIDMLDSHDCGVDTSLEVECPDCSAVSEVTLPLDQKSFWMPSRRAMRTGT